MKKLEGISNSDHVSASTLSNQPSRAVLLVPDLFEAQAERVPDRIALIYEDDILSYGALNEQVNRLAYFPIGRGLGPENVVGICIPRSPEMIIAVLSVLKAGAAYLPLDPDFPSERLKYILDDADADSSTGRLN